MTAVRKSAERPPLLMRFTVAQYHTMIADGILAEGQPYELLNGVIVRKDRSASGEDPMTVSYAHATAVTKLAELGRFRNRSTVTRAGRMPIPAARGGQLLVPVKQIIS